MGRCKRIRRIYLLRIILKNNQNYRKEQKDAEIVLVNKINMTREIIEQLPKIKIYWRISYWLQQYRPTSSQRTWRYCY